MPEAQPFEWLGLAPPNVRGVFGAAAAIYKQFLTPSSFTAVYKKMGDWYVAHVEELPGANTQGRALGEARENLREAVQLVLETNRQLVEERPISGLGERP